MTEHLVRALRMVSTLACAVILITFVMWASDEGRATSQEQVARVNTTGPVQSAPRPAAHDGVRGQIEKINAKLVGPFDGIADAEGPWVRHAIPALLALLAYGLLARLMINYIPQRR